MNYIDDVSEKIAKHSYGKHKNDFLNQNFGYIIHINNRDDFKRHAVETLIDKNSSCFIVEIGVEKETIHCYNKDSNTLISIPGNGSPPTMYRPKERNHFEKKIYKTIDQQGGKTPEIKNGIYELLPALEKNRKALMVEEKTPGQPRGPEQNLEAFVKGLPEKPPRRWFKQQELRTSPEARRESYKQIMDDKRRISALDRMSKDIRANRTLDANDIRLLSREDLEGIKQHGDKHLKEIVQRREKEREKDRGLER